MKRHYGFVVSATVLKSNLSIIYTKERQLLFGKAAFVCCGHQCPSRCSVRLLRNCCYPMFSSSYKNDKTCLGINNQEIGSAHEVTNSSQRKDGNETTNGEYSTANSNAFGPPKKIIVFGGDGFCGWPTSLFLSELGHEVLIVDNLSRRNIDNELEAESLTPIGSISERIKIWKKVSGNSIRFERLDIAKEYDKLLLLFKRETPDAIIHFAEQRAAPYSMKGSVQKRYTVDNNVNGTHNLLCAIVQSELDIHLVHLGTMGVYGYGTSGSEIPEGYIDVVLSNGQVSNILHPFYPGSVYHTTKCLDALLFQFYQKNDSIRITDLHQGIVWGTNTIQTRRDERLINRFDYDSDYGTVLNRFLMQAALGAPLTVYGTGGQTRAFIHIQDTVKCIALAVANPPQRGDKVVVFNQVAECHRVRDLAKLVSTMTKVDIAYISNPRQESAENELQVSNKKFRSLGYQPILLSEGLLDEVVNVAQKYAYRCDAQKILPVSFWNRQRREDCERFAQQVLDKESYANLVKKVAQFHDSFDNDSVEKQQLSSNQVESSNINALDEENLLFVLSKGNAQTMKRLKETLEACRQESIH
eukprot:jgi/Galph1/5348/GphlegSOOS_G3951.1